MKYWQVILNLLLPANEQPPKAVQPRMGPLDNPTSSLITRDLLLCSSFLPASANVSTITPGSYQLTNLWIVIALIHAHVLCFFSAGSGRSMTMAFRMASASFISAAVGTIYSYGQRIPLPSINELRFVPLFPDR